MQPHRIRTFKRSKDPEFAAKLRDIVGLYMEPPAHAIVLSIDEESQIQALDRSQPGLPLKPGKCGTMTHDYTTITPPPTEHNNHPNLLSPQPLRLDQVRRQHPRKNQSPT